jgi:hypothetical protein
MMAGSAALTIVSLPASLGKSVSVQFDAVNIKILIITLKKDSWQT